VISASTCFFEPRQIFLGQRDAIELLQQLADAAALEHHGAAGDFSGMRGEHGHDQHLAQPVQRFVRADADALHRPQRSGERAALLAGLRRSSCSARRRRLRWLVSARLMSSK
jgi:hypothetical protein